MNEHKRESEILRKAIGKTFVDAISNHNAFVAGGAVRSVFSSAPITDVDIFFHSKEDYDAMFESFAEAEYSPTFTLTDSAATHISTGKEDPDVPKMRYQLIYAEFGDEKQIISKFDFTMCMGAWTAWLFNSPVTGGFTLDDLFLKHVAQRRLCFNSNAHYPICSLWRAAKFIKRGWALPGIEAIKLALAINNVGINSFADLKAQLMGIDTIFLKELTDAIGEKKEAAYDFGEAIEFISKFFDYEG